ncbi:hypothetical protein OIE66_12925 [Nonomuraea sp. NBC_01738]|uniref:hypothetical protein n=1 Tax=Nonomuraea sp. NBC_01738 TaxID=2976003 RepID=UPI002E0EE54C|nr:hypothetical protein OIE66_12925 [Nonomuraea sp. NBC_01738]
MIVWRTMFADQLPPANLPVAPPVLIGREAELARMTQAGAPRRIVISGEPGIGKTSLCLWFAHGVADEYPDGQIFADWTGYEDTLARLTAALGRREPGQYRRFTRRRRVLVVIDDVPGGVDLGPLIPSGAGCALLVTSRGRPKAPKALHIELGPLSEHDATALLGSVAGPDRVSGDGDDALRLIRQCGAIPLAVSLAGAELATRFNWAVGYVADRVEAERQTRGQEDGNLLDVAYAFLNEPERDALCALSAVEEDEIPLWKLAAVTALKEPEAIQLAGRLSRSRLVELDGVDAAGSPRYRVREPVREYIGFLAVMAERRRPGVRDRWERRLARASMAREERDPPGEIREQVYPHLLNGDAVEALSKASDALSLARERDDPRWIAVSSAALAEIHTELGESAEAERMALSVLRLGDAESTARALRCLGRLARRQRAHQRAIALLTEARKAAEETTDHRELTRIVAELAVAHAASGSVSPATRLLSEADRLAAERDVRETWVPSAVLWSKGVVAMYGGLYPQAADLLTKLLGSPAVRSLQRGWALQARARVHLLSHEHAAAVADAEEGAAIFRSMHNPFGIAHCLTVSGTAATRTGRQGRALKDLQWAREAFRRCEDRYMYAKTTFDLGHAFFVAGLTKNAGRLQREAATLFDDLGESGLAGQALRAAHRSDATESVQWQSVREAP